MFKSAKNCRDLRMQTIKLRREKPSSLAIALALAVTMLIVYILSLQGTPKEAGKAAAALRSSTTLRMEAMDVSFLLSSLHDDEVQARIAAAQCAQSAGAGLVLQEGSQYAVVYEAGKDFSGAEAPVIHRSAPGLTLKIDAPAEIVSALSDAIAVLRALAEETASLASALDRGETDARTLSALLNVYRTRLQTARNTLSGTKTTASALFCAALEKNTALVESALANGGTGKIRLIHAAACAEWISLVNSLVNLSAI